MTATSAEAEQQWAVRMVLTEYRRDRKRRTPFDAACAVLNGCAVYLADVIVDDKPQANLSRLRYVAARNLHAEICRRAAVRDDRKFHQLTATEQFWNTGQVAA